MEYKIDHEMAVEYAAELGVTDVHTVIVAYNRAVDDLLPIIHELNEKLDGYQQKEKNQGLVPPI
jgi:hypothetical protein